MTQTIKISFQKIESHPLVRLYTRVYSELAKNETNNIKLDL